MVRFGGIGGHFRGKVKFDSVNEVEYRKRVCSIADNVTSKDDWGRGKICIFTLVLEVAYMYDLWIVYHSVCI